MRQYQVDGDKDDEMGTYFGYSSIMDVTTGAYNIRVQKIYSMTMAKDEANPVVWKTVSSTGGSSSGTGSYAMLNAAQDTKDMLDIKEEG